MSLNNLARVVFPLDEAPLIPTTTAFRGLDILNETVCDEGDVVHMRRNLTLLKVGRSLV